MQTLNILPQSKHTARWPQGTNSQSTGLPQRRHTSQVAIGTDDVLISWGGLDTIGEGLGTSGIFRNTIKYRWNRYCPKYNFNFFFWCNLSQNKLAHFEFYISYIICSFQFITLPKNPPFSPFQCYCRIMADKQTFHIANRYTIPTATLSWGQRVVPKSEKHLSIRSASASFHYHHHHC